MAGKVSLFLAVSALLFWSFQGSEFSPGQFWRGIPQLFHFFGRMTPPDWSVWDVLLTSAVETLQTTIAGTFLGALFAYPLGVLAASNWTPVWVHLPIKAFMAFVRSIPLAASRIVVRLRRGTRPFSRRVGAGCALRWGARPVRGGGDRGDRPETPACIAGHGRIFPAGHSTWS